MLKAKTFDFLKNIKNNNTTEWFKSNQAAYKDSRADFQAFTTEIITRLELLDDTIMRRGLLPNKCIKRINRDIRFSADKSPYKTNYFTNFNPNGYKSEHASYYLHLEPNNSFVGGGVYMPRTPTLNKFRKEIETNLEEWESLLGSTSFREAFPDSVQSPDTLKTVPKGFDKESPAIRYLRMKGFYTVHKLTDSEMVSENVITQIMDSYREVKPIIAFLNRNL